MATIEEALDNAMYHRGYDRRKPAEVRVNADVIEIVSYPGPDKSIRPADLKAKRIISRRYRNRRIGEFFTELEMTEGRGTGLPKIQAAMKRNGSPKARFKTNELRLWFLVELPIHKAFTGEASNHLTDHLTPQVTPQVVAIVRATHNPLAHDLLQATVGIRDHEHFRKPYSLPLLEAGWIKMTITKIDPVLASTDALDAGRGPVGAQVRQCHSRQAPFLGNMGRLRNIRLVSQGGKDKAGAFCIMARPTARPVSFSKSLTHSSRTAGRIRDSAPATLPTTAESPLLHLPWA